MDVAVVKTDKTKKVYSYLWTKGSAVRPMPEGYHFDNMQEVIPERIVKGSMLQIPFKDGVFDFAYSFGALHHTPDPQKGLSEISRIIKKRSPAFLYLYDDHSENTAKYIAVKIIGIVRKVTVKINPRILYALSLLCSPFIFVFFTCLSKILKKFKFTEKLSEEMPFNFGYSPFSLAGDLYDRFGAPIEHRFSKKEVNNIFEKCGFSGINITRLIATAGWVAWGYKKDKDA